MHSPVPVVRVVREDTPPRVRRLERTLVQDAEAAPLSDDVALSDDVEERRFGQVEWAVKLGLRCGRIRFRIPSRPFVVSFSSFV